jgi:hypothetical protein
LTIVRLEVEANRDARFGSERAGLVSEPPAAHVRASLVPLEDLPPGYLMPFPGNLNQARRTSFSFQHASISSKASTPSPIIQFRTAPKAAPDPDYALLSML